MCKVNYRQLNFTLYSDHVKNLHNYAFKALVWHVSSMLNHGIHNYAIVIF